MKGPVMLVVLDGFGLGDGGPADATALAHAPFFDRVRRDCPMARIETSGEAVGLPPGQMGNSEVGHMTLGAGRIIDMDMTRISKAFERDGVAANPELERALATGQLVRDVRVRDAIDAIRRGHPVEPRAPTLAEDVDYALDVASTLELDTAFGALARAEAVERALLRR